MTLSERNQWAYGIAASLTAVAYFGWLGWQLTRSPVGEIEFVRPLLWTLLASLVIHAVGRGIASGSVHGDDGARDERDRAVGRRAEAVSFRVFSALVAGPFALSMIEADPFWVTNALFLAFAATAVLGVVLQAVYYRTGAR
jgi:uncharacterized membrane protein